MHAVILVVLICLFILVCRSKSPTGRMLHVVLSTQNKKFLCLCLQSSPIVGLVSRYHVILVISDNGKGCITHMILENLNL